MPSRLSDKVRGALYTRLYGLLKTKNVAQMRAIDKLSEDDRIIATKELSPDEQLLSHFIDPDVYGKLLRYFAAQQDGKQVRLTDEQLTEKLKACRQKVIALIKVDLDNDNEEKLTMALE